MVELSTAQRQELQMKKSKLVTMLDEVIIIITYYMHSEFWMCHAILCCVWVCVCIYMFD